MRTHRYTHVHTNEYTHTHAYNYTHFDDAGLLLLAVCAVSAPLWQLRLANGVPWVEERVQSQCA